jgi:hypothetical protein
MQWLVFSYSLPSAARSSPRVALWRRLRRLGAVAPAGGAHILPARDECVEAFQWLAQEIRQAQGEALVMRVERFEGLSDPHLIELFQAARREEYEEIDVQLVELEQAASARMQLEGRVRMRDAIDKLRRRYADVARVDYFDCPEGLRVAARLAQIDQALAPDELTAATVAPAEVAAYRSRRWVTRPRPHVDRLACAWLIRRFIDPSAAIRYSARPEPGEIAFDMSEGQFGHQGNLCTFETVVRTFGLDDSGLRALAEIVHEIDLRDGRYARPETAGVDAILKGWLLAGLSDADLEAHGIALFDGLYAALS